MKEENKRFDDDPGCVSATLVRGNQTGRITRDLPGALLQEPVRELPGRQHPDYHQ